MVNKTNTTQSTEQQNKALISRFDKALFDKAMHIINTYVNKWQLNELNLFEFFSSNLIIFCVSPTFGPSVLKIQMSCNNMEKEIAVLHLIQRATFLPNT